MKKYLYINFFPSIEIGVEKRIAGMARAAKELNLINFDFVILTSDVSKKYENLNYIKYRCNFLPFRKYKEIFKRYQIIEHNIDLKQYDKIVLRYAGADKTGIEFLKNHCTITEHHTIEESERKIMLKDSMPVLIRILKHIRFYLEKKYGRYLLEKSMKIVGMTDEICKYEQKRSLNSQKPALTITNGISVKEITFTGFRPIKNRHLNIAMIASNLSQWHGVGRLIESANQYSGDYKITLHFIGNIKINTNKISNNSVNIECHGIKTDEALDKILQKMNIAVSTLALYKNKMGEACSLKTREYTARGLPFILAYDDKDLQYSDKNNRFFMQFPNDSSLIDFDKIIEFAESISKNKDISKYMRNYADKYMDWKTKITQLKEFIEI